MTSHRSNSLPVTRRLWPVWLDDPWGYSGIAAGIYLISYLVWFYFQSGEEANFLLISDITYLPLDLLAALVAWRVTAQQQLDARVRRAWLILGLAMFSFFIADVVWLYYENFLEVPPFPSIADIFYLGFYPLVLWGLLILPNVPLNERERWHVFSDLTIVMTTAIMFSWYFIIQPTAASYPGDLLAQLIAVAYPIGDLVVLSGIVTILLRRPEANTRSAMLLFALGMIFFVISDVTFGYTSLLGTYGTGSWIDSGWIIAHAFFIWAALRQVYHAPVPAAEESQLRLLDQVVKILPFAALVLGYGLTLYIILLDYSNPGFWWLFVGAILLTILIIIRQVNSPSFTHLSLRAKLILAFLVVAILSIGVVTLVSNQVIRGNLTKQVGANLQALARVKGEKVAGLLDKQLDLLQLLSTNRLLQDAVSLSNSSYPDTLTLSRQEVERLESLWVNAAVSDPLVQRVLNNHAATDLEEFQVTFPQNIEVFITDQYGGLVAAVSRPSHYDYANEPWWKAAYNEGQGAVYIGQPESNPQPAGDSLTIAVPIFNQASQKVAGVLRSTYKLDSVKEILTSNELGSTGGSDLLLPNGQIITSEKGELETLGPATLAQLQAIETQPYAEFFYEGAPNLVSLVPVTHAESDAEAEVVQQLDWKLIANQPATEALAVVNYAIQIALLSSVGALLLAGLLAFLVARQLVAPITRLTTIAKQVAAGDLTAQAPVEATDEVGALAQTFNSMTNQLRQTLLGLENRTRGLEIITRLTERLTAILKLEELMNEVVNQIKDSFGYYHAQIYLLDEDSENLVLTSATGTAGQTMLAREHKIPVGKGLVGQAAAKNSVVLAPNLARMILPEVVTQANVELIYRREADPALQTSWYHNYIDRTFIDFRSLSAALTGSDKPLKLGYILHFMGNFTQTIKYGAEDAARDLGLEIEVVAPREHGSKIEALALFEQMVRARKDGLVVIPELEDPWLEPFSQAAQAGIPIVTANSTGPQLAAWPWFGQEGYQSGFILANEFKNFLANAGYLSGVIVVGACTTAEVVISARYEGFKRGLEKSNYTITTLYETTLDPALNYQTWAELVQTQPDLIATVGLSAPDVPNLAKIKKETQGKWLIAGYDLVIETLEAVKEGLAQVVIGQHPYLQGYLPVLALAQHLREGKSLRDWMVEGWLPNPLLPDTKSEISVPINLAGQVVGVLDVQVDRVDGLDETDGEILRSLANQVAVAIHNARQFAQVQTALAEAGKLQQRYVEQSWDRTKVSRKSVGRVQFSLGESASLDEAIIGKAQQQALLYKEPTVVNFNGQQDDSGGSHVLVAPIILRDVVIGDLQLHEIDSRREWTESELAFIRAVVDQVAQAAENLRLLNETQERASREQLITQISNKMRRAPDMESLLKVAVTELSRVLTPARTFVRMDLPGITETAEAAANGKSD